MIQIFTLPQRKSCRNAIISFTEKGIPFIERRIDKEPLSVEELRQILCYCKDIYSLVTDYSKDFRKLCSTLAEKGKTFEDLTISEVATMMKRYPNIVRTPIIFNGKKVEVGYSPEKLQVFTPRVQRAAMMNEILKKIRAEENARLTEGEVVCKGHWA